MRNYLFDVLKSKKYRVIIHTDCKNEADDQFALAHALMTPKFIIKGIIAGHFDAYPQTWGKGNTAQASYEEVLKILDLMDLKSVYENKVFIGASEALHSEHDVIITEGARFIVNEAMKEDSLPLFILMQGAITDLACAILLEPKICDKMTAVWIGGGPWPEGGDEFNLWNDICAANVVFKSKIPLWQIPMDVYKKTAVSLAELQYKVLPCGKIGQYLFQQLVFYNAQHGADLIWPHGETWGLGDQAVIAVLLEELERKSYDYVPAPIVDKDMKYIHDGKQRKIRVYKEIDSRHVLEDFFAKLAINFK
mgnify:FL=1